MLQRFKGLQIMDSVGLVMRAMQLRKEKGLSQEDVANRLVESGAYDSLSKQMVSRAEDPRRTTGESLHALRVAIIEELSGKKIEGPVWYFEEDAV